MGAVFMESLLLVCLLLCVAVPVGFDWSVPIVFSSSDPVFSCPPTPGCFACFFSWCCSE